MSCPHEKNEVFDELQRRQVSLVIQELIEEYGEKFVAEVLERSLARAKDSLIAK